MPARNKGFTIMEMMISLGIVAIIAAIGGGLYFGYITESESATVLNEISDAEEKVQIAITTSADGLVQCDDTLLDVSQHAADGYLDFTVSSLPLDPVDPTAGSAPALIIDARVDQHGGEGIKLARMLHEELSNATNRVEDATVTDTIVTFAVRLNNSPACDTALASLQQPSGQNLPPAAPAPDPASGSSCKANEKVDTRDGSCMKVCNTGFHFNGVKCALGDCPAGQTLDSAGYCIAATPPPPAPASGSSCKANETVNGIDGSCMKACNAGFHFNGVKCVLGDCPAGQTLDSAGYCIASAPPPPPPPPPPPAPDPAAKLAGTTTDPAANLAGATTDPAAKSAGTTTDPAAKLTGPAPAATLQTPASSNPPPPPPPAPDPAANLAGKTTDPAATSTGPAPDPNPPAAVQKVARGAATTITEFPTKDNHPCKEGDVFIPGKGQTLGQYPMTGSCQEDSPNRPNKDPYAGVQCEVCGDVPPFLCERRHTTTTCTWPNNICMNHIINQDSGARTVDRTCTNRETAHREWYLGTSDNDRCQQFRQEEIYTLGFECRYACVHDNCNTPVSPLVNGKGVMW